MSSIAASIGWPKDQQSGGTLRLLIRIQLTALRNRMAEAMTESPIKIASTGLFVVLIWVGLYLLFSHLFGYAGRMRLESAVATQLLFNFFFVALLVMLTFSNAIISYGMLFSSREATYLLAAPIRPRDFVTVKLLEAMVISSWSFILLGLPLMKAIADSRSEPMAFYGMFLAFFLFFVPIPGALGMMLAWATARFIPRAGRRWIVVVSAIIPLIAIYWVSTFILSTQSEGEAWLRGFLGRMDFVRASFLPSAWVAQGIDQTLQKNYVVAGGYLCVTLANTLMLGWAAVQIVSRSLTEAYDRATSSTGPAARSAATASGGIVGPIFAYLPKPIQLIAAKDMRTFLRDPMQWSQLAILFGLMCLYLANIPRFQFDIVASGVRPLIPLLNLGTVSLILATFTTRFVFPLVSLEGHQLWFIGLLPLKRERILHAKLAFALTVTLAVALSVMCLASVMLQMDWLWTLMHLVVAASVCYSLCGLAVGVGARMPMFEQQNPARIANGFGGTVNLIASVIMITINLAVMLLGVAQTRVNVGDASPVCTAAAVCVLLNLFAGTVALRIGANHFKRCEI